MVERRCVAKDFFVITKVTWLISYAAFLWISLFWVPARNHPCCWLDSTVNGFINSKNAALLRFAAT
jgi:hypothetical protein